MTSILKTPGVLQELREHTRPQHESLERKLPWNSICRDAAAYSDFLLRFYGFFVTWLTGCRCCKAFGAIRSSRVPVLILTSSREEQDLLRSYELGVNAFVVKPVGFQEFIQAIQELGMFWAVLNEPPPGSLKSKVMSLR